MNTKNCLNCHFFIKTIHSENCAHHTMAINQKMRDCIKKGDFSWRKQCSLNCDFLVWSEGFTPNINLQETIIKTKRNDCFFWKYKPNMLLPAARKLQKRKSENEKLKRSLMYTRIGLYISAFALLINIILNLSS